MRGSVAYLMTNEGLVTIEPHTAVSVAVRAVIDAGISHLLVTEREALVGLVCLCDLDQARTGSTVADCMSRGPVTVEPTTPAVTAGQLMLERGISCLPVVSDGVLRGVITLGDLQRAGIVDLPVERCIACGSEEHVRCEGPGRAVGYCLECTRRSEPPRWDEDLGGG